MRSRPSRILRPASTRSGIICDVVSVEHAAGLMTRDDHGNLLRNAVADHISDPTSTEIMEQQSLVFLLATARLALRTRHFLAAPFAQENADLRRNTCRPPSVPEVSNWLAIVPPECACL